MKMSPITSLILLLLISAFLYELSSARSVQFPSRLKRDREDAGANEHELAEVDSHNRRKRSLFSALGKGLTAASWGAYGVSMASTVYHAIQHCDDYTPSSCPDINCQYLSPCPDYLCQNPEKNKAYVDKQKETIKKELSDIDDILLDAFKIEVDGRLANINNERILNYISDINVDIDRLANGFASVDGGVSQKFVNKSLEIQAMVQDKRTTLEQIVTSPLMQGIFDKWTWDGTGRFVFSLALSVGYGLYGPLKNRFAINKIYKEMKADFITKHQGPVANQNGLNQIKLNNRIVYVEGLTTKAVKTQLKKAATVAYEANQANKKQSTISKAVGPAVNTLYIALSVWSTYAQWKQCQDITNDMYRTALNITGTRDQIKKIEVTEVQPLIGNIYDQTWKPVTDLLTNETILDLLEGIANLTVEANFKDTSPANTIKDFIAKIGTASTSSILSMQKSLSEALRKIQFQFDCISHQQHAFSVAINDCKSGRKTLQDIFTEGEAFYNLNTQSCIDDKFIPRTTINELQSIISATASAKGWYDNCLLNSQDLLYRVCSEKAKGYVKTADILTQVNNSALTEEMVTNFLTRCPPPEITPKNRKDTCLFYCLYQPTQKIAQILGLLESQVNEIISSCGICAVSDKDKTEICSSYFCKEMDASTIETTKEIPLPTVNDVIKNCEQKCVLTDSEKQQICQMLKCEFSSSNEVARSLKFSVATIDAVKSQCDTIISRCTISVKDKENVLKLHCKYNADLYFIKVITSLPSADIQNIINSQTCDDFFKNGVKSR